LGSGSSCRGAASFANIILGSGAWGSAVQPANAAPAPAIANAETTARHISVFYPASVKITCVLRPKSRTAAINIR
jgi:hypothetical protein